MTSPLSTSTTAICGQYNYLGMSKRVAVIGAGVSGLVSIKSCLEEGFLPVCYEKSSHLGGLWRYHEDDTEGLASVMRTTIINTSKELGAFSDFPPPKEYPNFMHNSKLLDYFTRYAKHFKLLEHIRYNHEVMQVEPVQNFDQTGQWIVSVRNTQTDSVAKELFDAVMVCVGHHVHPSCPTFPCQDKFGGKIVHTHSIKSCDQFKGQKVAVIGIGNSGVDAAVDSAHVASQVYLSTRKGSWILSRVGVNGRPYDIDFNCRWTKFFFSLLPYGIPNKFLEDLMNSKFNHAAYNLKPKHRLLSAHPTINDALPNEVLSGRVVIKNDIEKFHENGILFSGDTEVTEIDVVILATGYKLKFPFLSQSILSTGENRVNLYKYCILPYLKPHTLAVIGLIQPFGSIFPISEMQSRWFVQYLAGKMDLPSKEQMYTDIYYKKVANSKRYVESDRHTIQVDYVAFMDELAEMIGVKPNFWKMVITDPKLFWVCMTGPTVPYQYRLTGPHCWPEAKEAILTVEDRIYESLNPHRKKINFDYAGFVSRFFLENSYNVEP